MTGRTEGERGLILLPSGAVVRGCALAVAGARADFTLVLAGRRPASAPHGSRWVRWRDFRAPSDHADALDALREASARAPHERVEVACRGGRGRTGTALAALLVLEGVAPDEAIRAVRTGLHPRAVETRAQRRWLLRLPVR